jgi:hypothetical protein
MCATSCIGRCKAKQNNTLTCPLLSQRSYITTKVRPEQILFTLLFLLLFSEKFYKHKLERERFHACDCDKWFEFEETPEHIGVDVLCLL